MKPEEIEAMKCCANCAHATGDYLDDPEMGCALGATAYDCVDNEYRHWESKQIAQQGGNPND